MTLPTLLNIQEGTGGSCVWRTGKLDGDAQRTEDAARLVAREAMRERCVGADANFQLWDEATAGTRVLNETEKQRIRPFIRTGFGLPTDELPDDHLEGYVAEFVWFLVTRDQIPEDRNLDFIQGPGFHVTGPGGDGLAVYEHAGRHIFRLWEIKKHTGTSHVSSSVARAYKQLKAKATEYLAQITALAKDRDDEVGALLAQLVDLWIDSDGRCGAGVAVSTSTASHPSRCFGRMHTHFPALDGAGQLEGLVVGLDRLPNFAKRVRDEVWRPLST